MSEKNIYGYDVDPPPPSAPPDDGRCAPHGRYLCPRCAAERVAAKRAARRAAETEPR